jgi:hypothetical protein
MSAILAEFASAPSEHLKIAVRGQHIERWKFVVGGHPSTPNRILYHSSSLSRFNCFSVNSALDALRPSPKAPEPSPLPRSR